MRETPPLPPFFPLYLGLVLALGPAASSAHAQEVDPSGGRMQDDVRFLASDWLRGRLSGTLDARMAADFIARNFEDAGLAPAGDAGSWFQAFERRVYEGPGPGNGLAFIRGVAGGGGKEARFEIGRDFQVLALSASGEFEAPLVFAGYGVCLPEKGYDDYAGIEVRGKAILVLRGVPGEDRPESPFAGHEGLPYASIRRKAETAREKGAVALLVANDPAKVEGGTDGLLAPTLSGDFVGPILPALHVTAELAETLFLASGRSLAETAEEISRALAPASCELQGLSVRLETDVRWRDRTLENVLARVPGADPALRDDSIVVGAHYDHLGLGYSGSLDPAPGEIHNGADDNASGTAVVLELARRFAAKPAPRSIQFVLFTGEELGLFGSGYYVEHPTTPLERTVAMVNLDMVGRFDGKKIHVGGAGTAAEFGALLDGLAARHGLEIGRSESGFGPSDHTSFYSRRIPVLFFFTGSHEDYHRSTDDWQKIDPAGLAGVARVVEDAVRELASAPGRPTYQETAPPPSPSGRPRVRFGVIPDYASGDTGGLRLSGVAPGAPAERAGLAAGDVLVRFGRFKIENIYDLTEALTQYAPGDEVEVVVRRNGAELAFRAKLEGSGG